MFVHPSLFANFMPSFGFMVTLSQNINGKNQNNNNNKQKSKHFDLCPAVSKLIWRWTTNLNSKVFNKTKFDIKSLAKTQVTFVHVISAIKILCLPILKYITFHQNLEKSKSWLVKIVISLSSWRQWPKVQEKRWRCNKPAYKCHSCGRHEPFAMVYVTFIEIVADKNCDAGTCTRSSKSKSRGDLCQNM